MLVIQRLRITTFGCHKVRQDTISNNIRHNDRKGKPTTADGQITLMIWLLAMARRIPPKSYATKGIENSAFFVSYISSSNTA